MKHMVIMNLNCNVSCETFKYGKWKPSHKLIKRRMNHIGWETKDGVLLMGGRYTPYSTELVTNNSDKSSLSFRLEHPVR